MTNPFSVPPPSGDSGDAGDVPEDPIILVLRKHEHAAGVVIRNDRVLALVRIKYLKDAAVTYSEESEKLTDAALDLQEEGQFMAAFELATLAKKMARESMTAFAAIDHIAKRFAIDNP